MNIFEQTNFQIFTPERLIFENLNKEPQKVPTPSIETLPKPPKPAEKTPEYKKQKNTKKKKRL